MRSPARFASSANRRPFRKESHVQFPSHPDRRWRRGRRGAAAAPGGSPSRPKSCCSNGAPMSPSPTAACPTTSAGSSRTARGCWCRPPKASYARFDLDVRVNTEVMSIDPQAKVVVARNLKTGKETTESYDALVLSPGAEPDPARHPRRRLGPGVHPAQHGRHGRHPGGPARGRGGAGPGGGGGLHRAGAGGAAPPPRPAGHRGGEARPRCSAVADPEMTFPLQEELARQGVDLRLGRSVAAFEAGGRVAGGHPGRWRRGSPAPWR